MITTGLYAYIRHPFCLSFILISSGIVFFTLNFVALLLLPAAFMGWSIEDEERELLEKYGKEYQEYMRKAGRFLPKVRKQ